MRCAKRVLGLPLFAALLLAGCATLPPAKPVQDLKVLSGNWTGTVVTRGGGSHTATMTINDDGTYVAVVPTIPPGTFKGTARVVGGKVQIKSETTGRTGTWTLHEGDGQRVLIVIADDGSSESRYTPQR
jgi:hypothetical protein